MPSSRPFAGNVTLDAAFAGANIDAKPGPHVMLQVTDSGTGIPSDVIDRIFDPFFTTKDVSRGTGLGLSTSLAIVKSHGGFIQVDGSPGIGATFRVYLPAQVEAVAHPAPAAAADLPRGHGELILVVDDEAPVRQVTRRMLRPDVRTIAASGVHARGNDAHAISIASVRHFLPKPYSAGELLTTLQAALSEQP
jgi:hypothetical protein